MPRRSAEPAEPAELAPGAAIFGPLGPAQLTCLRSWRRCGYRVLFVHVTEARNRARAPATLRGTVDGYLRLHPDRLQDAATRDRLLGFLLAQRPAGIAALSYEYLRYLHELAPELPPGTAVWGAPAATLPFLESKLAQIRLARDVGLPVAPHFEIALDTADAVPADAYPLVVRPDGPNGIVPSFKVEHVAGRAELDRLLRRFERLTAPLVGQSFIAGTNYVVHGARFPKSGRVVQTGFAIPRMLGGVTLTMAPCALPGDLLDACARFVAAAGIEGVYHFEFRRPDGADAYCFLDLNGRLGGTTGKAFRLGFDEPQLMACAFLESPAELPEPEPGAVATNRQALIKAALGAARSRLTVFDYPHESRARYLAASLSGLAMWRDELYAARYPLTSLAYFLDRLSARPSGDRAGRVSMASGGGLIGALQRGLKAAVGEYQVFLIYGRELEDLPRRSFDDRFRVFSEPSNVMGEGYDGPDSYGLGVFEDGEELTSCWVWYGHRYKTQRNFWPLKDREAKLIALETVPQARGRGLAPMLLDFSCQTLADKGFVRVFSRIWHSNKTSIRTLRKSGWSRRAVVIEVFPFGRKLRWVIRSRGKPLPPRTPSAPAGPTDAKPAGPLPG